MNNQLSTNSSTNRIRSNYSSVFRQKNQSLLDELQILDHNHTCSHNSSHNVPSSVKVTPERKPRDHQQLLSTIIANSRVSNYNDSTLPHSYSPQLSPSRFLCSSIAIIHDSISHSFGSVTEYEDWYVSPSFDGWEDDHNSLIYGVRGVARGGTSTDIEYTTEEEGLEIILNRDLSLTYVPS
jgi:hypothetical protein